MKRFWILVILLFIYINCFSSNILDYLDSSKFYYRLNSFVGSDYFPDRSYHEFVYFDKHKLNAGWIFEIEKNSRVWIEFSYENDLFDKRVIIHKTGFSYQTGKWEIQYKLDRIEIGKKSYIFNQNVKDIHFDKPVIEEYRFDGLDVSFDFNNYSLSTQIGGNSYNTTLIKASMQNKEKEHNLQLFYLFSARSKDMNEKTHSFGLETYHDFGLISFYGTGSYQLLYEIDWDRILFLAELICYPTRDIRVGSNYLYSIYNWEEDKTWQSQSFLQMDIGKFSNLISFRYNHMDNFIETRIDREINLLSFFNLSEIISVGTNFSYYHPSFYDEYYQFGLQGRINYETD